MKWVGRVIGNDLLILEMVPLQLFILNQPHLRRLMVQGNGIYSIDANINIVNIVNLMIQAQISAAINRHAIVPT